MSQDLTAGAVRDALRVDVVLEGRHRRLALAVRPVVDVVPDVREAGVLGAEDLQYHVLNLIDTFDDDVPALADAIAICSDALALSQVLGARNRLWSELQLHGRLFALCPHCRERESSFSLATVALVLRAVPPSLFGTGGLFLQVPALADPRNPGARFSGVPLAARLRTQLPSASVGLEPPATWAVLRDLDTTDEACRREAAAWQTWAPDGFTPPTGHAHRFRGRPGFRAILRLSVALAGLDLVEDVTPETVEAMSLADFLFLDSCYYLTHNVNQPRGDALVVQCELCRGDYLPLR